ncbi:NADH-quinone oxidoreductase subunit N [Geobacter sp. OR-1]|uniref:NADH-quinone oxidoreductase subunit N n=1 Tax=Geobacter sp. OR-1 TaxID=1266765 RepID=UPI000541E55A|nr:NADH-quinone oxidoreductase subunit N [Geobacter sp. OR-1]GAM11239.1 NADH-quinone oxidoreductase subunit N [Geobacter sp. OR-1]
MDMLQFPANIAAAAGVNFAAIMPEVILSVIAMALLLVNVFINSEQKAYLGYLSLIGIVVTFFSVVSGWGAPQSGFNNSVLQDNFSLFFKGTFLVSAFLTILITDQYLKREECNWGEIYPLILFATVGMMLMASGTDLMTIFLGLEVLSVSLYVLAGFNRANLKSNEAGLKYFLLGAFSTGFLLYGMALIYGSTGTTRVAAIASYISQNGMVLSNPMLVAGMLLMAVGFSFKIAAAPFHMWTPDVYEGAPTPMTAFMSVGPKAAGFAAFLRVFIVALPAMKADWSELLWVLAVLTMTVGNITALKQTNIKRMLAYSSIAHAGYVLVGFTAGNAVGTAGVLFYMLSYAFMNIGAFAIIVLVGRKGEENNNVSDYAGFGFKHPVLGMCMSIFLFSLAGIPPAAGFIGKFYLFSGAIQAGYVWLAIIGVLNSAASVYYYLRVMVFMYMKDPTEEFDWLAVSPSLALCLLLSVAGVLIPGIVPGTLLDLAQKAILM